MYKIETITKDKMGEGSFFRQMASMFNIPLTAIDNNDSCEIWGTEFKESGPDRCEARFFKGGQQTETFTINGY